MKFDPLAYKIGDELKHRNTGDLLMIAGEARTITIYSATENYATRSPSVQMPYWPVLITSTAINNMPERYTIVSGRELMMEWIDAKPDRGPGYYRKTLAPIGGMQPIGHFESDPGDGWTKVNVSDATEADFDTQRTIKHVATGQMTIAEAQQLLGDKMDRSVAKEIITETANDFDRLAGDRASYAPAEDKKVEPVSAKRVVTVFGVDPAQDGDLDQFGRSLSAGVARHFEEDCGT